jgi:hypothetical protein
MIAAVPDLGIDMVAARRALAQAAAMGPLHGYSITE